MTTTKRGDAARLRRCIGCDSNFYNGNNDLGVKRCWSFATMRIVWKWAIGWWTPQGKRENFRRVQVPSCFSQTGRTAYLDSLPRHLTKH